VALERIATFQSAVLEGLKPGHATGRDCLPWSEAGCGECSGESGSPDVATIAMADASAAMPQWAACRVAERACLDDGILAKQHHIAIYWPEKAASWSALL
jgi:hypothetical protein